MKVKIKVIDKNIETKIPAYSRNGDAGLDLVATSKSFDNLGTLTYGTNLAVEIPEGYVGLLFSRSSISKYNLYLTNAVGVIDSNYRGEIMFKFSLDNDYYVEDDKLFFQYDSVTPNEELVIYNVGDKVGQLIIIPYPTIEFEEIDELSSTERGDQGFGSSGK